MSCPLIIELFKFKSCAPATSFRLCLFYVFKINVFPLPSQVAYFICRLFYALKIKAVPLPRRFAYFMFFKINVSSVPSHVGYFIFQK